MEIQLRSHTQIPPRCLLRSLDLLPDNSLIRLLFGPNNNHLVLNGIVPFVEVEIGGEESSDDRYGGKDESSEEDIVASFLVCYFVS